MPFPAPHKDHLRNTLFLGRLFVIVSVVNLCKAVLAITLSCSKFSFSLEECGRYLETVKVYENKPADLIQGQLDADYLSRVCFLIDYCL